ncbi:MAG TPA: hypothetical protein VIN71_09085 [Pseudomonadales bacterium]
MTPPNPFLACLLALLPLTALAGQQPLANTDWLLTPEKRGLLRFITECALPENQLLVAQSEGVLFEYYGQLGAAPGWNGFASSMTDAEQRWVSACVLARVNYFGTPVPINLRTHNDGNGFSISASEQQKQDFPYFEGGFFGNLFTLPPKQYVCTGDAPAKVLIGKNRICTLPSILDRRISECGFVIIGSCDEEFRFERDDIIYREVIYTWLRRH